MRILIHLLLTVLLFTNCRNNKSGSPDKIVSNQVTTSVKSKIETKDTTMTAAVIGNKQKLALTSNALQLVDAITGSTKEIIYGVPYKQIVTIVRNILEREPAKVGVNTECGAGPLKMASWSNGLTLVFKETKRDNGEWLFAGWFASKPQHKETKLSTMAGVGVGSTLAELKSAYEISVSKTTLGQEFAVKSGFYGLLSGIGDDATIDAMWSGVSCNFR
ncbi:hypothetical protein [Flavisolibacter ginsengisoli]|jgi:hypothetical protein|uniref:Uncharacterized protein n=1 Tax=Flavisolibacter ginsengisoli DSM 18119 TaxID=1121884 RepID=A0A1M4U2J8_9BACT|nr:hypothetical protein [Flavisolibacter ginsengisoli]SHE50844.1 hypothetical protein SAMN02745131_00502 [Flavisolibacter ginsengisoli DSM 18119]